MNKTMSGASEKHVREGLKNNNKVSVGGRFPSEDGGGQVPVSATHLKRPPSLGKVKQVGKHGGDVDGNETNLVEEPIAVVKSVEAPMEDSVISFRDVKKEYFIKGKKKVVALNGVSFDVEAGDFVFLVGPSGSGKSTILRLLIKEESITSGDVIVGGVNIGELDKHKVPTLRRQVGTVFQDFRLLNDRTVAENVAFTLKVLGHNNVHEQVAETLALVGLGDKGERYPNELSGGEQQRAAIARAFVSSPPLLVADEPTGNLDPETSEDIMSLLNIINLGGTTVLMATHDVNIVNSMKKRVIRLNHGEVVKDEQSGIYGH